MKPPTIALEGVRSWVLQVDSVGNMHLEYRADCLGLVLDWRGGGDCKRSLPAKSGTDRIPARIEAEAVEQLTLVI